MVGEVSAAPRTIGWTTFMIQHMAHVIFSLPGLATVPNPFDRQTARRPDLPGHNAGALCRQG